MTPLMQMGRRPLSETLTSGPALVLIVALVKLALHLWTNAAGGYGYFRDELYYLACTDHLEAGYVDQPPLSIYILAVNRLLFGDSLFALRLLPAITGALVIVLAGRIAQSLGGGRMAQLLAALGTFASLILFAFNSVYTMNAFDILLWALGAYAAILLVQRNDPKFWLALGVIVGLGSLNKISMLWFGAGLTGGFILSPHRSWFRTRWPYVAGAIVFFCFLPYLIWNVVNDFAHLEFIRNATADKYSGISIADFLMGQILLQNPVTFPLWLSGVLLLLFSRAHREYRFLGLAYLFVLLLLMVNVHSKPEYMGAAYPMLFAAGGVAVERFAGRVWQRWLRPAYAGLLAASGLLLAPALMPILPVEAYIAYADALGIAPSTSEGKQLDKLPQFYADMFGWPEKAAAVAEVYNRLTPDEQAQCAIFADNYGRCGAIDFFGRHYGLPKSIGRHNSYWLWGPREYTGEIVIILGGGLRDKQEAFEVVQVAGTVSCTYCMPYEDDLRIYLCRGPRTPLAGLWASLKHYQ